MKPDPSSLTLTAALGQLRRGEISARDLTEACLDRIERLNPRINAFITKTPDLAREAAAQADALVAQPPSPAALPALSGIPVALKDLFETAGILTTAGSRFLAEHVPARDAAVVERLRQAGAAILGKTSTHEIALGVTGVNPHYGAVRNPWDFERVTGGSSSGSAAAVATGMCLAALGTDTGGSIRIPAALCGIVGFKPTFGRVSTRGVMPLSWNLDHVGPLARTVRDAALLFSVIAGHDPDDPASPDLPIADGLGSLEDGIAGSRVALVSGGYVDVSDPQVTAAVAAAAEVFRALGARLEAVEMPWLHDLALANVRMTQADAAAFHRERLSSRPEWFGADVRERLQAGASLAVGDYALARRLQTEARRRFERFFERFDLLLLPTTPIPAPPIEGTLALEAARRLTRFTAPFNLTGLPALSLPCGFADDQLPIGLQIVGGPWCEAGVLRAGHAYEQATHWHDRHPLP